jgi:hypothetical protein
MAAKDGSVHDCLTAGIIHDFLVAVMVRGEITRKHDTRQPDWPVKGWSCGTSSNLGSSTGFSLHGLDTPQGHWEDGICLLFPLVLDATTLDGLFVCCLLA